MRNMIDKKEMHLLTVAHDRWYNGRSESGQLVVSDTRVDNYKFSKLVLRSAWFRNVKFTRCDFVGTMLCDAVFENCTFAHCSFLLASMRYCHMKQCLFVHTTLHGADFNGAELYGNEFVCCYPQAINNVRQQ